MFIRDAHEAIQYVTGNELLAEGARKFTADLITTKLVLLVATKYEIQRTISGFTLGRQAKDAFRLSPYVKADIKHSNLSDDELENEISN